MDKFRSPLLEETPDFLRRDAAADPRRTADDNSCNPPRNSPRLSISSAPLVSGNTAPVYPRALRKLHLGMAQRRPERIGIKVRHMRIDVHINVVLLKIQHLAQHFELLKLVVRNNQIWRDFPNVVSSFPF